MARSGSTPCASCKLLRRRRCTRDCVFAPYFPPEDPHKFAIVHKVFGASNVSKMLQVTRSSLAFISVLQSHHHACRNEEWANGAVIHVFREPPAQQRADAVSSLVYEANARTRDPVYGCVGAISYLQQQVSQLQMQLAVAQAEILCIQQIQHDEHDAPAPAPASALQQLQKHQQQQHMDVRAYNGLTMQSGLMNNATHQLTAFGSAGSSAMMLQEACLKKESLWTS